MRRQSRVKKNLYWTWAHLYMYLFRFSKVTPDAGLAYVYDDFPRVTSVQMIKRASKKEISFIDLTNSDDDMDSNDGDIFSIIQKYIVDGDVKAKQEKKTAVQEKEVFVAEEQQPLFQLVESEGLPDLMETIVDVSCDTPEEFDAIVAKVRGKNQINAAMSKEASPSFSNVVVKVENGSTRRLSLIHI